VLTKCCPVACGPKPKRKGNAFQAADDGNVALEVSDLLYAETQEPLRKRIVGKTVEVVGQFLSDSTNDEFKTGQNVYVVLRR
jgi:hypothetical protein